MSAFARGLQPFATDSEYQLTSATVTGTPPQVQVITKLLPEDDLTIPDWDSVALLRMVPISASMNEFARIYDEYYRQRFHPLDRLTHNIREWIDILGQFVEEFSERSHITLDIFKDLMIFFGPLEGSMKRIQSMIKRRYFYRVFTRENNNKNVAHTMLMKRETGTFFWRLSTSQKRYVFCYNAADELTGNLSVVQKLIDYDSNLNAFIWRSNIAGNKRKNGDDEGESLKLYDSIDQLEAREPEFKMYAKIPWDFGVRPDITYAY
jgi:hypothetical protein